MRRRAFTLIELLVVITVIALLAVLMLPSFATTMSIYRDTQCRNNLKRLGEGFILAGDVKSGEDGIPPIKEPGYAGLYPPGMLWPAVPANVVKDVVLFQCPEDEIVESPGGEAEGGEEPGALVNVEYESPYGYYPLDTIGEGNCYKSRRGRDAKGPYTEYIMQDDEGTDGQYAKMNFNGWIDTDGGCRIYDSGTIDVWKNIANETVGSVPDFSGAGGIGYPTGINTCPELNSIRYMGEPFLEGNGKMQDARGKSYKLPNWVGSWGWGAMTNYGINTYAFKYDTGGGCIVLVDYKESRVDLDDPHTADGLLLKSARHFGRVNYMMADGSVNSASPMEISPQTHIEAWKP